MRATRLPALDGLRGVLAVLVVVSHVVEIDFGSRALAPCSETCVLLFFALSAHVLTRSWGRFNYPTFLLRRLVRLWPVFAVCMLAGFALSGAVPDVPALTFQTILLPADPPSWSLAIEVRAMLLMPVIAWSGRGGLWRSGLTAAAWLGAVGVSVLLPIGLAFLAGARLSALEPRMALFEHPVCQWLGRCSYSLYLSHWVVLAALYRLWGAGSAVVAIPLALGVGHALWWAVERPSIVLSHRVTGWPLRRQVVALARG